jgi:hypothetical protein
VNRRQLEHILRAAGAITDEREIVVLGSQAVLASFEDVPEELQASVEADAFPLRAPEKADLIDGTLGELSPFHDTHGYYAHGITPESTVLPDGWQDRLVRLESPATQGVTGLCLAPADVAVSKLAAGREKDIAFVAAMLRHRLTDASAIESLAAGMAPSLRESILRTLRLCLARRQGR